MQILSAELPDDIKAVTDLEKSVLVTMGGPKTLFKVSTLSLCRSSLLDSSDEIKVIKDRGELVPDTMVGDALLNNIFDPAHADGSGLLIDGFPRTALQV